MKEALITVAVAVLVVGLLFGAAIVHWGWNSTSTADDDLSDIATRPIVPFTPLPESQRFHGVAVQLHNCDLLDQFKQSIRELADTGADTVLLSLAAYQENAGSSTVTIDLRRAPNHDQMVDLIRLAKSFRLRVILMPIVLLDNPRGTEWRGRIVPADPDRWWADYREYIKYYAKAAVDGGADLMMIGSELNKQEGSVERWRDLIRFLREPEFKGIKLGYSANWDRYWKVRFWNDLDFAGVTTYYTLAEKEDPTPTVDEIVQAWDHFPDQKYGEQHYKEKLISWQRTIGKPVIFTEVGWYSRTGVSTRPWDYYYNQGHPSPQEQRNLYEAFLKVWADQPMVGGVIFWEWTSPGGPTDEGYTPKGKPAEQVMRAYFKAKAQPTTQPATDKE